MSTSKAVNQLKGKWIYRSLVNDKTLNTPFANLQFGLGIIEFKKIAGGEDGDFAGRDAGNGPARRLRTAAAARRDASEDDHAEHRDTTPCDVMHLQHPLRRG